MQRIIKSYIIHEQKLLRTQHTERGALYSIQFSLISNFLFSRLLCNFINIIFRRWYKYNKKVLKCHRKKRAVTTTGDKWQAQHRAESHWCDCLFAPFARTRSFWARNNGKLFGTGKHTRICWPASKVFATFS